MTREELLKSLIKDKYGSILKFSEATDIPESSIRNIFNRGLDSVNSGTLVLICRALNVDIEALMDGSISVRPNPQKAAAWEAYKTGLFPLPRTVRKPRLGAIACGTPIEAIEHADEYDDVPETVDCDFTLLCKGDSMINARIFDGDVVYIKLQPEVENGQIAAVLIDGETTLKKVYYYPNQEKLVLRACNPLYADMVYSGSELEQASVIGLAVGFFSMVRHEQG